MKSFLSLLLLPFTLVALAAADAKNCGCACCKGKPVCCCHEEAATAAEKPAEGHPLRGVIVNVLPTQQALLVKHEEIPGVMPAMTMLLRVDEPTLATAVKGQAITAVLYRHGDDWWLRNVVAAREKTPGEKPQKNR